MNDGTTLSETNAPTEQCTVGSPPLPTTKSNILHALSTESHFSSQVWHDTWYGYHHPRRRILLLFLSYCIVLNISTWSFILNENNGLSWDEVGDQIKCLEDCATDVCAAFRDVEFECEWNGAEAHVVDWSIPDSFKSTMPGSCLDIVNFGYNLIRDDAVSEDEEGYQPSQEPFTLPNNYTWLQFEFMEEGVENKAIVTFTSSCKILLDLPYFQEYEFDEFDLIDHEDQDEGNRKIHPAKWICEDIATDSALEVIHRVSATYYWVVNHQLLVVSLVIGSGTLFYSLVIYLSTMAQALLVALLIRWFLSPSKKWFEWKYTVFLLFGGRGMQFLVAALLIRWLLPPSKECIKWKYMTLISIYWSLVLLSLTVNIDLIRGSIFALISAIVYRDKQAAIEWTFIIGAWYTASIWEPSLVSFFEETLPQFDGLGIIRFVGSILWLPVPSTGGNVICSKVLWVYAFVQSYPGRIPSFLNVFLLKNKFGEDDINNNGYSNIAERRAKQD